tara:strand:- start:157 stop:918 length:762 start_codon:yes stop_codon:yes gene_type:complete
VGEHEHIIILPYYCKQELKRFEKLSEVLDRIIKRTNSKFVFLLVGRWDSHNLDTRKLSHNFNKLGVFKKIVLAKPSKHLPKVTRHDLAKIMFVKSMMYIKNYLSDTKGFALWFESDCILTAPDSISCIEQEWNKKTNALLMGKYISYENESDLQKKNFPSHINGVACYSKNIIDIVPPNAFYETYRSFDVFLYNYLLNKNLQTRIIKSELWEHRLNFDCNPTEITKEVPENKKILHGCKDEESFEFHLKNLIK